MIRKSTILSMGIGALLCTFHSDLFAQLSLPKVIPPSPDAASLGKFGDVPLGKYTGAPSVNIPLYEIKSGTFTLPIALNYHSGGVKVEEEASLVGLGWALQAGGVITRSTKGRNDLGFAGYPASPAPNPTSIPYMQQVAEGNADPEPDIFYYNFAGKSGKFILTPPINNCYSTTIVEQEKIRIEYCTNSGWTATTIDGVKFLFTETEWTIPRSGMSPNSAEAAKSAITSSESFISGWYLSNIILPTNDTIHFEYVNGWDDGFSSTSRPSMTHLMRYLVQYLPVSNCLIPNEDRVTFYASRNTFFNVYLKEIRYRNLIVKFKHEDRTDIEPEPSSPLPQRLKELRIGAVENGDTIPIKSYDFLYDYFNGAKSGYDNYAYKRLRLLSITERNGTLRKNPYEFIYAVLPSSPFELPSKESFSRDFWGFYNGKNNENIHSSYYGNLPIGGSLMPPLEVYAEGRMIQDSGADRNPVNGLSQAGMLTTVKYPTGGTTTFDYESHGYSEYRPVTITRDTMTYQFGPLVQDPPNYGPDRVEFTLTKAVTVRVSTQFYCWPWQETGGSCQNAVMRTGGINRINEDGSKDMMINFATGQNIDYTQNYYFDYVVNLMPGSYEVYPDPYDGWFTTSTISYQEPTTEYELVDVPVGGMRIGRITEEDGVADTPPKISRFMYADGLVMHAQNIFHAIEDYTVSCYQTSSSRILTRRSSSSYPLATGAQGNHIGYGTVTVLHGESGENGKTVYRYVNYPEEIVPDPPIPDETTTVPIQNGQLLSQTEYKRKPTGGYQIVQSKENTYNDIPALNTFIPALKVYTAPVPAGGYQIGMYKYYAIPVEKWNLIKETVTNYDDQDTTKFSTEVTEYAYGNNEHRQLTSTTQTLNGKKVTTSLKYPADFANADLDPVSLDMKGSKFMHGIVLQRTELVERNGITKVLNSQITKYGSNYLPGEVALFEPPLPTDNTPNAFPPYKPVAGYSSQFKKRLSFKGYDGNGNLLEYQQANGIPISYVWDPEGNNPIAEAKNASSQQIFHTSFEYGVGSEGDAKSGHRYLNQGTYTIPFNPPAGATYVMSYWYWENNKWNFSEVVPFASQITRGTKLDEIRVYPATARMTTYTYAPFIGMTSSSDENNVTKYFQYDALGRLKDVYNDEKKILSEYKYHYQGQ